MLYRNNISAFSPTPNLTYLSLRANSLNGLHPETFWGLVYLETLDLSKSGIFSINPNLFRNLISLKEMYLDQNTIFSISADHFRYLHSLKVIKLQRNQIKGVIDKEFVQKQYEFEMGLLYRKMPSLVLLEIHGCRWRHWMFLKTQFLAVCDLQWFRKLYGYWQPDTKQCKQDDLFLWVSGRIYREVHTWISSPNGLRC